jgi:hypothetical protein
VPLIGFLWDYGAPPFEAGAAFDPSEGAAMSLLLASSAPTFGHTPAPFTSAGDVQPMFGGDFYDRFHFSTLALELGNVVGDQQRTVLVWNAFRRARILEALTLTNAGGISVGGQPAPPLQFAPQQERTYTITIGTDGPPVILATITFDFDLGQSVSIELTGIRVTAWSFRPNWADPMIERLEWRTDVLQAYRGEEQVRSLRLNPRQYLEFGVLPDGQERRHMEAAMWSLGARTWAVPLWFDGMDLPAQLAIGATSIAIDTSARGFRDASLAILLGETSREYEIIEIDAANPSELVLERPTTMAWPAGTRIYPARAARIDDNVAMARFSGRASDLRIRFEMTEPELYEASAGATTYRGYPVLTARPDWSEDPTSTYERKLAVFDPGTGPVATEDEAEMPMVEQTMRWILDGRDEIDRHRKLAFALRGKFGRIWVPTWTDDIIVVAPIGDSAFAIDIEWTGYTQYYQQDPNRRDIRIELVNGAVYYRRVTASSELDADTERLLIDTALGVNLQPNDIAQVSFLALSRQSGDAAEFSYFSGNVAEVATTMRSTRNDA